MIKDLFAWFSGLFSMGLPAAISLSSGLPGTSSDAEDEQDYTLSDYEHALELVSRAEAFAESGLHTRAKHELEKAEQVRNRAARPHTPRYKRLESKCNKLWEKIEGF